MRLMRVPVIVQLRRTLRLVLQSGPGSTVATLARLLVHAAPPLLAPYLITLVVHAWSLLLPLGRRCHLVRGGRARRHSARPIHRAGLSLAASEHSGRTACVVLPLAAHGDRPRQGGPALRSGASVQRPVP